VGSSLSNGNRLHGADTPSEDAVTVGLESDPPSDDEPELATGSMLSRYVVLEEVGRGGMGRVLRAYDPKLEREVALKQLHHRRLDVSAAARLVVEARAMAKLSNPHVVAIYDVEELGPDRVVLAMELVRGTTLSRWLRADQRHWSEIIDIFIQAGRGLVAAHAAGLLHRDFKPSNVLVSEEGTAKVMDFGLAKMPTANPSSDSGAGETVRQSVELTLDGTVMGTPRYMAPEQHFGDSLSAATDQYGFCVALWEALCGEPPFAGTPQEIATHKQAGPPSWPATAVPRVIADAVARGMEPRPGQRWPSMRDLLDALSAGRSRRRGKGVYAAVGLAAVGLSGVAVANGMQAPPELCTGAQPRMAEVWNDATRTKMQAAFAAIDAGYASDAWAQTNQSLDDYSAKWVAVHTEACEATTVRRERSAVVMDLQMGCLRRAAVGLRVTVETLAEADAHIVQNAQRLTGGLTPLSRCEDIEALSADVEPPLPGDAEVVAQIRDRITESQTRLRAGNHPEAQAALDAARSLVDSVDYGPVLAELLLNEGVMLDRRGRYDEAEATLAEALELATRHRVWSTITIASRRLIEVIGYHQMRVNDALAYAPLARGAAGDDPLKRAAVATSLAMVLTALGRADEGEAEFRKALALREEALGPDARPVWEARNNVGAALSGQGRYAEAAEIYRSVVTWEVEHLGADHPEVGMTRSNLGNVLGVLEQYTEAEEELRASIAIRTKSLGADHPETIGTRRNLVPVLQGQGKLEEAEALGRESLSQLVAAIGADHPGVASARYNLAEVLRLRDDHKGAVAELDKVIELRLRIYGEDHPDVARAQHQLAANYFELEQFEAALPLVEKAWANREKDTITFDVKASSAFLLAQTLWEVEAPLQDRPRARELAETAQRLYSQAEIDTTHDVADVERWLDRHDEV